MSADERLADAGLTLPPVAAPVASYVPALRVGDQIWTSGQIPLVGGKLSVTGTLGAELSVEQGADAARTCALNALAAAASIAGGDLDAITGILKVTVFVASAAGFTDQALVANGASTLLEQVFGENGRHVRSAVGVASLPLGAPVEVELVVQTAED